MTRHQRLLAGAILGRMGEALSVQTLDELFALGLVDLRSAEKIAVRSALDALAAAGMPRCEALHVVAREFSCSYEKVRGIFYETSKS